MVRRQQIYSQQDAIGIQYGRYHIPYRQQCKRSREPQQVQKLAKKAKKLLRGECKIVTIIGFHMTSQK